MNLFVWCALYFLVGSFVWGIKHRRANPVTADEYAIVLYLVVCWPLFLSMWMLALPFRFGQWLGKRWPG